MVTANVQTLGRGPEGYIGKLDYIQQQFSDAGVCVVGIQEARTDEIFTAGSGSYLRLASGSHNGHHRVELWLSATIVVGLGSSSEVMPQFFTVIHGDYWCVLPTNFLTSCSSSVMPPRRAETLTNVLLVDCDIGHCAEILSPSPLGPSLSLGT